jgi:cysteine desulfurase
MNIIYMDNAAGTRLLEEVFEEMRPFFTIEYGNPSSIHTAGMKPKAALEQARERVAHLISAEPGEIYFTSCGSESNNFAVKGAAWANVKKGRHIVISEIEHQSVLNSARTLGRLGYEVTTVESDSRGFIDPDKVFAAVRDDTVVVSITHASNEIGTIEPLQEIASRVREKGVLFHTDAVQTAGVIPVDVNGFGVDMLSLAANSFYGPKGAAALYIREKVRVFSLIDGGIQERGRRAGTENVPAIVGLGKAAEIARRDMHSRISAATALRDKLMNGLEQSIPKLIVNGDRMNRLPGNVHVSVEAIEGESMIFSLAGKGILASSGSSCADKALKSSHVLKAIGCNPALANASVLFSLGFDNTEEEVDRVLEVFPPIVERLRSMSPLWKD